MLKKFVQFVGMGAVVAFAGLAAVPAQADIVYLYYTGPNYSQFEGNGFGDTSANYLQAIFELSVTPTIGGGMQDYSTDLINWAVSDGRETIYDLGQFENIADYASNECGANVVPSNCSSTTPSAYGILSFKLDLPTLALNDYNFLFPGDSWSFSYCGEYTCFASSSTRGDNTYHIYDSASDAGTFLLDGSSGPSQVFGTFFSPCSALAFPDERPAGTIWDCSVNRDSGVPGPVNVDDLVLGPAPATITAIPEPFTLSLFGAGIAGAAALRRRKKTQKA